MGAYFPEPRPEIRQHLAAAETALRRAMAEPPRLLRAGNALLTPGEHQREIYALRSGFMARSRRLPDGRGQIMTFRLPGDLLGLRTLVVDRYPDVLRAITPATIQALSCTAALDLARSNPDVALRFMWQLVEDERRLHNWIVALGRGHAIERIATLFLDIRARLMQAGLLDKQRRFGFPVTQQQIADHLGLTLVHVNRTLKKLRERNVMSFRRGVVEITDLQALSKHAAPLLDIFEQENPAFGVMFASSGLEYV